MTIQGWLKNVTNELQHADISSAALDAEILLAHTLKCQRAYLHAHGNDTLDARNIEIANARIDLRRDHTPVAYIIGHKEFYGRSFHVTPSTLIPRPESEEIIELLNEYLPDTTQLEVGMRPKRLVDIGTGSGCLGITAKLEHPELDVTLLDISKPTLSVATKNAKLHNADIETIQSNLLRQYPYTPDIVLANLPYVDPSWDVSKDVNHEPREALFADNNGLQLIQQCFEQLSTRTKTGAVAIFEADPRQWDAIIPIAKDAGFDISSRRRFAVRFIKC